MDLKTILELSQEPQIVVKSLGSVLTYVAAPSHRELLSQDFYDKDTTCEHISTDLFDSDESKHIGAICAFSVVSILFTSSVAIMMKRNSQLMAHPNRLIFYMCLCEGVIAWQAMIAHLGPKQVICYFELERLWAATYYFHGSEASTIVLLAQSNFKVLQFFEFVSLALNLFLCLDIVLTMRNPFYPHERRMKFYLIFSLVLAAICFPLSLQRISAPANEEKLDKHERALFSVSFLTVYIIFAITSVAYAWRVNTRPGMSTSVRKQFIWRHSWYVTAYIATWIPYLGFAFYILYVSTVAGSEMSYEEMTKDVRFSTELQRWFNIYNLTCIGTGIIMSIVRVFEPVFMSVILRFFYQFFGEIYEDGSGNKSGMDSTLLSFLMSSLNIELVHIILTTVSQNTVGTPKSLKDYKVYQNYDHSNKNTFVLDSIEIEDRKQWDINAVQSNKNQEGIVRTGSAKKSMKARRETLLRQAAEIVNNKLVINEDIEVTEYAPDVFAFLRQKDGYDNEILRQSLDPEANRRMVFKAGESQGKSGSFFFFSADQRFIIKTMTDDDFNAFQRIQKAYFAHVIKHDNSLLARVYGIYSVQMEDQKPVKLIVMENGMRGATEIQGVFDLKGSMVNRIEKGTNHKATTTLKDQNLLKMNQEKIWIRFSMRDRKRIMKVMQSDIKLLQTYNLMDYSLLTCIQENPDYKLVMQEARANSTNASYLTAGRRSTMDADEMNEIRNRFEGNRHKFLSKCGRYIYHIGIIDYLQDFNFDKKLENFFKQTILQKGDGISAVPPPVYGARFLRFMRDYVIIDQKEGFSKTKSTLDLTTRRKSSKVKVSKLESKSTFF